MDITTVNCPSCSTPNYASATKCGRCGEKLNAFKIVQELKAEQHRCPQCHSDNTSSFEMIYQSGTSTGKFSAYSFNYHGNSASTFGISKSQSLLAQQVTPPKMPNSGCGRFIGGILLLTLAVAIFLSLTVFGFAVGGSIFGEFNGGWIVVSGSLGAIIGIALALLFLKYFSEKFDKQNNPKEQRENWQQEIAIWQNSWLCLKCGNRWIIHDSANNLFSK